MRWPTLSRQSSALSGCGDEPAMTPEERIAAFKNEILAAIPLEECERLEDERALAAVVRDAEVAALYLARFWHKRNPWWADEALQVVFDAGLPVTKATKVAHSEAMEVRKQRTAHQQGQMLRRFEDQKLKDIAFVQIETMRKTGIALSKACGAMAVWLECFSKGSKEDREKLGIQTVPKRMWKAETLRSQSPRWRDNWLGGKVWADAIRTTYETMDNETRKDTRDKLLRRLEKIGPAEGILAGEPR